MAFYNVNSENGNLIPVAGGTLYADTPIGTIISSGAAWDNPPAGYLFCGGQAISRTAYAALFAVIGTSFGAGDGSTTFNVPELRGEFLRGAGTNQHAGQGNGGAPGYHQDATEIAQFNARTDGTNVIFEAPATVQNRGMAYKTDKNNLPIGSVSDTSYYGSYTISATTAPSNAGAYSTRPTNTSVNFFIKATNVAVPADFINAVDDAFNTLNATKVPVAFEALPNNDCNDAHVTGFHLYRWGDAGATHSPNDLSNGTMFTFVYPTDSGSWVKAWQQCYTSGNKIFLRDGASSDNGATFTWNAWRNVSGNAMNSVTGSADSLTTPGFYTGDSLTNAPSIGWYSYIVTALNNDPNFVTQLAVQDNSIYTRALIAGGTWSAWKQVVANTVQSSTYTIPAQTLANGANAEIEIPLVPYDFYCGRIDFANLPSANMTLSYNDFSGTFQDTRSTEQRTQYVLYPIGKANLATLHVYITNYTGSPVTISDIAVTCYLEHHKS